MADYSKHPNPDAAMSAKSASDQAAFNNRMESSRPASRGDVSYFNRSQYGSIGNYMYPSDLMDPTNQYGGNFVIFYINVHEDSYLLREGKVAEVEGNIPPRQQGFLSGQQVNDTAVKTTGVVLGAVGGGVAGAIAGSLGVSNIASTTIGGAAIGGMAMLATVSEIGSVKAQYKQIKDAIALYIPSDMSVRYGVQWAEEDMAGAGAIFGMGENLLNAAKSATKNLDASLSELQAGLGTASSFVTSAVINATPVGQAMGKMSGVAANPKKEQIFRQVDYRSFTFSYQFFSRSPEEAQQIRNIIKLFKLHMHPEYKKDTGNFLYLYPSEFDIYYYNNGKENMNLHRHTSCVLTDMTVVYTPMGQFVSFADGMPTQINITLQFRELALLSKELIEEGF